MKKIALIIVVILFSNGCVFKEVYFNAPPLLSQNRALLSCKASDNVHICYLHFKPNNSYFEIVNSEKIKPFYYINDTIYLKSFQLHGGSRTAFTISEFPKKTQKQIRKQKVMYAKVTFDYDSSGVIKHIDTTVTLRKKVGYYWQTSFH